MMVLKRKEILIGVLIVLIGVAGYINWNYAKLPEQQTQTATAGKTDQIDEAANTQPNEDEFEDEHSAPLQEDEQARKMGEAQYVSSSSASAGYFAEARMNRESSRSKSIEMLNSIVNNSNSDADSKKQAQDEIMKLAAITDKETTAENLIRAKGFEDAVVYLSDNMVNVTVKSDSLSSSDMAKIQEITTSQTGISIKNIKIVEVK